jgi:hypothetical protein
LSVTVKAPVTVPAAVGVNVTATWQLLPAGSITGQLFVSANPPLAVTLFAPLKGLPPKFATVIVWGGLAAPTFCEMLSVAGVKLSAEGRGLGRLRGTAAYTFV